MSKNLTRKGLAFGAIVALGASLFSAAPAFAADELTLVPSSGTLYKVVAGETFKLTTGLAPATNAGNIVQLKYQIVTDPANGTVSPVIKTGATTYANTASNSTANTAPYNATSNQASIASVPAGSTNTIVYSPVAVVGSANSVELTSTVTGTTAGSTNTAKVTAFFDANANGKLDSGEYSSAERTVTWVLPTDVKTTVTLSKVTVGDSTLTATATLDGINTNQITIADYGFLFRNNDGTKSAITDLASPAVVATVKTNGDLTATTAAFANSTLVVADKSYRADVVWKSGAGWATTADTDVIGTGSTIDAVKRTIATIDAEASGTVGVASGSATQATTSANGSLAVASSNVKGTSTKVVATVKDADEKVVAGAAFKVTVTGTATAALSSTNSYSINDKAYTTAPTAALEATSDASGQVTFTVANATAITAGQTVILTMVSQNITNVVTITFTAPVYSIYDVADNAGSFNRTVLKASAYSLTYKVVDQFGDAPSVGATATTAFRLVDVVTTTNTGTYYANVAADGTATLSFATAAAAGNTVHTVQVQKTTDAFANFSYLDDGIDHNGATAGGLCVPATGVDCASIATTVVVKATSAEVTASKISIGTPTKGAGQASITSITAGANGAAATFAGTGTLASTDFKAYDGRGAKTSAPALAKGYSTAPTHTLGAWTAGVASTNAGDAYIRIPVRVIDSTVAAAALDGVSTTVSGKGLLFVVTGANSKVTMGVDSLTFLADNNATSVDVYSHVTGEQSIVFTSGAATATQKITFANYGTEVAAVALGTLPAQAQAGSTVSVSAVATDKWGNVVPNVQIAFSNTGAGYVQDTAAQLSDSKGSVSGRVIVLQNDLGTSYITATAAKAKTLKSADLASAKSVEFGLVDADVVSGGRRVFVNAEFAKGRTITVTIDGKRIYSKVQTTDNAVELAFTQKKAGLHTVTVRISGGIVFSERVRTN